MNEKSFELMHAEFIPSYSSYEQFRKAYPFDEFQTVWNYGNRMVLSKINLNPSSTSRYLFFCRQEDKYEFITSTEDFKYGESLAERIWNPQPTVNKFSTENFLLEHVEQMLLSMVTKNKTDSLEKFDALTVYYSNGGWRAFYPNIDKLVSFHSRKTEQNQDYLTFLQSDKHRAQRELWNQNPNVKMPVKIPK